VSASTASRLTKLATTEPASVVRAQLACSARRLPAEQGLPIVSALMRRSEDVNDRYIPLLLWWAIEEKTATDRDAVLAMLADKDAWAAPTARKHLIERLARRYTAERSAENFAACARLLEMAPDDASTASVIAGMDRGLVGTALAEVPAPLRGPVAKLWERTPRGGALVSLALRLGLPDARDEALRRMGSRDVPAAERVSLVEAVGDAKPPAAVAALLRCAAKDQPKELRGAALSALQQFDDPAVAEAVLKLYREFPTDLRARVVTMLTSRGRWARSLLEAIEVGDIDRKDLPIDQVRRLALHGSPRIDLLATKLYGSAKRDTPEEKKRAMDRLKQVLATGPPGDAARGKPFFVTACGQCHALHGEGNRIGPDLTGYDRRDLDAMLMSIVDPSAAIRPEFAAFVVQTTDGRVLNGPIVASDAGTVTVEDGTSRITVARDQVKRLAESPVSRMPEGLLDGLTEQQVRDLFAYLATERQ
jgi:putative heme-binding domain-containing protein